MIRKEDQIKRSDSWWDHVSLFFSNMTYLITFSLSDTKSGIHLHQPSQKMLTQRWHYTNTHTYTDTHCISLHCCLWHFSDLEQHPWLLQAWSCDLHIYDTSAQQGLHKHTHTWNERQIVYCLLCHHILTSWFKQTETSPLGDLHTSFLRFLPHSVTLSPFLDPLLPLMGIQGGIGVRQMEAGEKLLYSQSQVCSSGNAVMEKERKKGETSKSLWGCFPEVMRRHQEVEL